MAAKMCAEVQSCEAAMDISINKPAKDYFKRQFEQWYSEQGTIQLEGRDLSYLEAAKLQPIDLGMPVMKEIGAKWLVDVADYIIDNPQFTVNGCLRSGITGAADDQMESDVTHSRTLMPKSKILTMGVTTLATRKDRSSICIQHTTISVFCFFSTNNPQLHPPHGHDPGSSVLTSSHSWFATSSHSPLQLAQHSLSPSHHWRYSSSSLAMIWWKTLWRKVIDMRER